MFTGSTNSTLQGLLNGLTNALSEKLSSFRRLDSRVYLSLGIHSVQINFLLFHCAVLCFRSSSIGNTSYSTWQDSTLSVRESAKCNVVRVDLGLEALIVTRSASLARVEPAISDPHITHDRVDFNNMQMNGHQKSIPW